MNKVEKVEIGTALNIEVFATPDIGLEVSKNDEDVTDIREVHIISTTHSGTLVKIRRHNKESPNIDEWTETYIKNPRLYARITMEDLNEDGNREEAGKS